MHVPLPHDSAALARSQITPQPPQFVSVFVEVSQPLPVPPSQFAKPALQVVSVQVPDAQLSPAFGMSQPSPQPPQFVSELSAVSQPLASSPSQFAKPALHVSSVQLPLPHDEAAFDSEHIVPQLPQLAAVLSAVSQPFAASPSQLAKPLLQLETAQAPAVHASTEFARLQMVPQVPQFATVLSAVSQPFDESPSQLP